MKKIIAIICFMLLSFCVCADSLDVLPISIKDRNYYVDPPNGTDGKGYGLAPGSDAFATIQYAINQIPKYLKNDINIYCANDTYNLTEAIIVEGFIGTGNIFIYGETGSSRPASGNYHIDTGANNIDAFKILNCDTSIAVEGFYIDSDTQNRYAILASRCYHMYAKYCTFHNFSGGIYVLYGFFTFYECDFDDNDDGLINQCARVFSYDNTSSTTNDRYGLWSDWGGTIGKSGGQPTGASGNENVSNGGVIR